MKDNWMEEICHDCRAKTGEIHDFGCDMEKCPKCGKQLISCGCFEEDEDKMPFRIPFILAPIMCRLCGEMWPDDFMVSDDEWKKYVIPPLQEEVLCKDCYEELIRIFPDGWKK